MSLTDIDDQFLRRPLFEKPGSKLPVENTKESQSEIDFQGRQTTEALRSRSSIQNRTELAVRKRVKPFRKINKSTSRPKFADYDYYDYDDPNSPGNRFVDYYEDFLNLEQKVEITSDGHFRCLDVGTFPHPYSCKKFISCYKLENGALTGWVYTCPRNLKFDPIGAMCNYSETYTCEDAK